MAASSEHLRSMMTKTKTTTIRRLSDKGPLQDLLLEICPPDKDGMKSITVLAAAMTLSSWAVYRWIKTNRIPPQQVKRLVKLSKGLVPVERILPFVIG